MNRNEVMMDCYAIETAEINVAFKALGNGKIPDYFGAIFKGVLGKSLHELVCIRPEWSCTKCPFNSTCPYGSSFEPLSERIAPELAYKMKNLPPPIIIDSPRIQNKLSKGEQFSVRVKVFGYATKYLNEFIEAIKQVANNGLGPKRVKLGIADIRINNVNWNGDIEILNNNTFVFQTKPVQNQVPGELVIVFETPMRVKNQGKIVWELQLEQFIHSCLRRAEYLYVVHGLSKEPPRTLDLTKLSWETVQEKWVNLQRYSSSQKKTVPLGGVIGTYILKGALEEILPIIELCSYAHIGKQTVYGLGKFNIFVPY